MAKKASKKSAKKSSAAKRSRAASTRKSASAKKKATRASAKSMKKSARKTVKKSTKKTARSSTSAQRKTTVVRKARSRDKSMTGSQTRGSSASTGGKVGSSRRAVQAIGGRNDFGIPAQDARDRALRGEPLAYLEGGGPREARGDVSGDRDSGAGAPDSGPGSASGGDVDVDIVGVGTGSGLAQSGPDELRDIGAAETDGSSDEFASGPPARGENQGGKMTNDETRNSNE